MDTCCFIQPGIGHGEPPGMTKRAPWLHHLPVKDFAVFACEMTHFFEPDMMLSNVLQHAEWREAKLVAILLHNGADSIRGKT